MIRIQTVLFMLLGAILLFVLGRCAIVYRRHHIDKLVKMAVKPAGLSPSGRVSRSASAALWHLLTLRTGGARQSRLGFP